MAGAPLMDVALPSTITPDKDAPDGVIVNPLFTRTEDGKYVSNVTKPATNFEKAKDDGPHQKAAEIVRQVEHYFSDNNLKGDSHLLALAGGDGNGPVAISVIHGFAKMKKLTVSESAVTAALQQSIELEVVEDKYIKRRRPLIAPLCAVPEIQPERTKKSKSVDPEKPWLTKAMLKSTGFEEGYVEPPVEPKLAAKEREWYYPDLPFDMRIEKALQRFALKRKFHQHTKHVFDTWMQFGGVENGQKNFQGGLDFSRAEYDEFDKEDIADRSHKHFVNERVEKGLGKEEGSIKTWTVDFEGLAKAFLSTHLLSPPLLAETEEQIYAVVNIMRTFYKYLRLHNVCPEYDEDIVAALAVCDLAADELPQIKKLFARFPGQFNMACSTLNEGHFAGVHHSNAVPGSEWEKLADKIVGMSNKDASRVAAMHLTLWIEDIEEAKVHRSLLGNGKVVSTEELHMQIVSIERASEGNVNLFTSPMLQGTFLKPTGKLVCKRWETPYAAPVDLPLAVLKERKTQNFEFYIEDETLELCKPGIGLHAIVNELDVGIKWLDQVMDVYPTFFTYLPNDRIGNYKPPGPPKKWMQRQMQIEVDEEDAFATNEEVRDGVGDAEGEKVEGVDDAAKAKKQDDYDADMDDDGFD